MVVLLAPPAVGGVELEGPEEVGGVLEVGPNGVDLMHEILHALNIALHLQLALDEEVVGDGNALSLDLQETSLVDQIPDGLEVGVTPGDVGLTDSQHINGGLVQLHKYPIVDLPQAEELQDFADFGSNFVDTGQKRKQKTHNLKILHHQISRCFALSPSFFSTPSCAKPPRDSFPRPQNANNSPEIAENSPPDTDNKCQRGFCRDVICSLLLGLSLQLNNLPLLLLVLTGILFSPTKVLSFPP